MKRSVVKNYIYNLSYQILAIIIPLITTPYLARVLGAENIGIYSYTLSIATYFILIGSLGTSLYGQKEIAYVQDNKKERSKKFFEIFILKFIVMIIALLIFYFGFVMNSKYGVYYSILLFELIATIFDISWFFQGMEEFKKTVIRNMIVKIICLILIFLLIKNQDDFKLYFWIFVISNLIGIFSLWTYVPKYIEKINFKELNIIRHVKPCVILFIPQIATQIYTVLDKTMIGIMVLNISEVAYYEQSQKIVKVALALITSLGTVMMARISNHFAKNEYDKISKALDKSFSFVSIVSIPLMFGIIAISDSLIPWFLGDGYEKSAIILKVISPIIVFISLTNVIGIQYLLPTKKEKDYTLGVVSGAVTNFVANLILIRLFNSVGAAIATVLAEFIVLIVMISCTKNEFDYKSILLNILKYTFYSLIMFVFCMIIQYLIKPSFICMIIQGISGMIVYVLILIISKDKLILELLRKIKRKTKLNNNCK